MRGQLVLNGAKMTRYEIHTDRTQGSALECPFVYFDNACDEACSKDILIIGTYLHGLFESTTTFKTILAWAGLEQVTTIDYHRIREENIDRLADAVEEHLDTEALLKLLGLSASSA